MEAESQPQEKPMKEPFSMIRTLQSASLIGATFTMLRGFNRFATQRQRLKAFGLSGVLMYTAVSVEMGWFPFSLAVSQRVTLPSKKKEEVVETAKAE